ncbi:serine hydrolase domain-containing protein [Microbacterium indicum]|uniref:serine hydrolase domain-containing protein n=1 Tax=Microbacterium indicum TaxID=358100 RepID=UPI00048BD938|nr:serine hydrolase domain-containing protein [Microbacterium indicum]
MRFSLRRRRTAAAAAIGVAALLLSACTGSNPSPSEIEDPLPDDIATQLQDTATHGMAAGGASGAIVGVWVPGVGDWTAGIGDGISTDMTFRAGQITRSMTCDVLYALDRKGTVSLDDAVTDYIPSVPQLSEVTLVELCDGTSGVASSLPRMWGEVLSNPDRDWEPREFASGGLGGSLGDGESWADSDTAFDLLGIALSNAAHESYADLVQQYVADAAGLEQTRIPADTPAAAGSNAMPGYYTSSSQQQAGCTESTEYTKISPSYGFADSSAVSTLTDLRDYVSDLAGSAGSSDDLAARWASSLPTSSDGDQWIRAAGGDILYGPMLGQEGSILGYSTAAYSDVDSGLTVVVALNDSAGGGALAGAIARELAAVAATAPADTPASLPWTAEQARSAVDAAAVCPIS